MKPSLSYLEHVARAFEPVQAWTGPVSLEAIQKLVKLEWSDALQPCDPILHILSSNTPHGAFQTLLRGLILGSHNYLKLPRSGLPEFEIWIEELSIELRSKITISSYLPEEWLERCEAIVVYGNDNTVEKFRHKKRADQLFVAHGHKVSIAFVLEPTEEAATLAAKDVSLFDQLGCLSPIAIYVPEGAVDSFAHLLADKMEHFNKTHPRQSVSPSTSGAISNLRNLSNFRAANLDGWTCFHSRGNTDWTVIGSPSSAIESSPLHRCVYVKPWPKDLIELGHEQRHIASVALYPYAEYRELSKLPASRFVALGTSQEVDLNWKADGYRPLASLMKRI